MSEWARESILFFEEARGELENLLTDLTVVRGRKDLT